MLAGIFSCLWFLSLLGLIIGLINPKLVIWWGEKKTRGRATLIYGLAMISFFILTGITAPPTEEKTKEEEKVAQVAQPPKEQSFKNTILEKIQNDSDYQEWLEIDKRTSPFKKNKDWCIETLRYLREKDAKWKAGMERYIDNQIKAVRDPGGYYRLNKTEARKKVYHWTEETINETRDRLKSKILATAVLKDAKNLPVSLADFTALATQLGFDQSVSKEASLSSHWWIEHTFYSGLYGQKGPSFKCITDSKQNVFEIWIPLEWVKVDFTEYPQQDDAKYEFHKKVYQELISASPAWLEKTSAMVFGDDTQTVLDTLQEIGKMTEDDLKKASVDSSAYGYKSIRVSDNFLHISFVKVIGDKRVYFLYIPFGGRADLIVRTEKTACLHDYVDELYFKKK